ncbi:type II secretion system protein J [Pontiella sp.]|uniref:PulJ/GspJ family protein n=1 Tax=Pontiella sp. TaxID=2837462 RepID=UPI00356675D8
MKPAVAKRGFTLLEIVVSIAILSMMALMIAYVFSESDRAVQQGKDQALLDETARLLLDYLEEDIGQALVRTNVAFRVGEAEGVETLYFISPGIRRRLEDVLRDTAPMRLQVRTDSTWNRALEIDSPDEGASAYSVDNVIKISDYYSDSPAQAASLMEFEAPNLDETMDHSALEYTKTLQGMVAAHAMLTDLSLTVNGDPEWAAANPVVFTRAQMPRFVDVTIALAPSPTIERATQLFSISSPNKGVDLIRENERIYSRRIHLPNRGIDRLNDE